MYYYVTVSYDQALWNSYSKNILKYTPDTIIGEEISVNL